MHRRDNFNLYKYFILSYTNCLMWFSLRHDHYYLHFIDILCSSLLIFIHLYPNFTHLYSLFDVNLLLKHRNYFFYTLFLYQRLVSIFLLIRPRSNIQSMDKTSSHTIFHRNIIYYHQLSEISEVTISEINAKFLYWQLESRYIN